MLDNYLSKFKDIQKIIVGKEFDPTAIYNYHKEMTSLMIDSVSLDQHYTDDDDWRYKLREETATAQFPALPIIKQYGNTHKPWIEVQKILEKKLEGIQENHDQFLRMETISLLEDLIQYSATSLENIEPLQIIISNSLDLIQNIHQESVRILMDEGTGKTNSPEKEKIFSEKVTAIYSPIDTFLKTIAINLEKGELPYGVDRDDFKDIIVKAERYLLASQKYPAEDQSDLFREFKQKIGYFSDDDDFTEKNRP